MRIRRSRKKSILPRIFWLIVICAIVAFSFKLYQKYSFTNERADLAAYLGVTGDDVAIYINDELQDANALKDSQQTLIDEKEQQKLQLQAQIEALQNEMANL